MLQVAVIYGYAFDGNTAVTYLPPSYSLPSGPILSMGENIPMSSMHGNAHNVFAVSENYYEFRRDVLKKPMTPEESINPGSDENGVKPFVEIFYKKKSLHFSLYSSL